MKFASKLVVVVVALLLVLYVPLGLFLARGKEPGARHERFPHAQFAYEQDDFTAYIAYSKALITAGRVEALSPALVESLAPYALEPDASCARSASGKVARGIVLIHGLFDTPTSLRPLGEDLRAQCYYVLGLLLPDHATRPGDFLDAHWQDWAEATHFAAAQLALHAETLFLGGHSAGGTLGLYEAARNEAIDALVLFAPALSITPAAKYARFIAPLGRLFAGAAWFELRPDEAVFRYESITFESAAQTYALIEATKTALAAQTRAVPIFTVASMQDNTVGTQAILDYMAGNTLGNSQTVLYSQYPIDAPPGTTVVPSGAPEQRVLSVSHLGLMTPPSHPYYGRDGAYRNCGHYFTTPDLFARCKAGERDWYGEVTDDNLAQGLVERIAFNPYYSDMLRQLAEFTATVQP